MRWLFVLFSTLALSYAGLPEREVLVEQVDDAQHQLEMQDAWHSNITIYGDVFTGTFQDSIYVENYGYWKSTLGVDWNLGSKSAERQADKTVKRVKLLYDKQRLDSLKSLEVLQKWRLTRRVKHYESFLSHTNNILCSDSLLKKKRFDLIELQSSCYRIERYKIQANLMIWQSRDSLMLLRDVESKLDTTSDTIDVSGLYKNNYKDSLKRIVKQGIESITGFEYDLGFRAGRNFGRNGSLLTDGFVGVYFSVPLSSFFGSTNKKMEQLSYLRLQEHKLRFEQNINSISRANQDLNSLRVQIGKLQSQIALQITLIEALKFRINNALEDEYDKLLRATVDLAVLQFQLASMLDDESEMVQKLMFAQGG
jgi:hypothetical protein